MKTLQQLSPYVRLVHDFQCAPDFLLPRRRINDHALLYFRQGQGRFIVANETCAITPGTVFLIRPDVTHSILPDRSAPVHMLNLHFDLVQRADSARTHYHRTWGHRARRRPLEILGGELPVHMAIQHVAAYERLFHVMFNAYPLGNLASQLSLKAAMIELLAMLFRQAQAMSVSSRLLHHLPQLERAAHFMGANLDRPLTLAEMARAAALSRSYFATSFAAYYRISPARFHLRQRIEKAAMELILGPRSVKEVATAYGFQTVHHFSRCFGAVMGMPPAAYRLAYGSALAGSSEMSKTNGQK